MYQSSHVEDLKGAPEAVIHFSPERKALTVNMLACFFVMVFKPFHFTLFFVEEPGPTF